ncbi:hypothetical protein ACOYW6_11750 [Parablastomonas sp. CN1-191]|uniref:hypothetical protein n=1 Tax=Parablastomonas sp. CN1-191 TaxID=3400908 RepID=UPI003BF8F416
MGGTDNFTLITGIASLIGFAIQIFDVFPTFARFRRDALLLAVGLFIGSFVSGLSRSQVTIDLRSLQSVTPMQMLIGAVALVTAFLLISARFQANSDHRQETYAVGFCGAGLIVALLIGYSIYNSDGYDQRKELSLDEKLILVQHSRATGNYDRALDILQKAKNGLDSGDERIKSIDRQIDEVTKQQVSSS